MTRTEKRKAIEDLRAAGCPHVNTTKTITREAAYEYCDDCGASRSTFVVEPNMKEGQTLAFRPGDFVKVK